MRFLDISFHLPTLALIPESLNPLFPNPMIVTPISQLIVLSDGDSLVVQTPSGHQIIVGAGGEKEFLANEPWLEVSAPGARPWETRYFEVQPDGLIRQTGRP